MVQKIDGRAIAERLKKQITKDIVKLKGPKPNLAIILVGERSDSKLYVSLKEKIGKEIGIDTHLYKLDSDTTEEKILEVINFLNKDELIDGILIQLPLPKKFNTDKIILALDPKKDVDGFHPQHPDYLMSPVLASVLACLAEINFVIPGNTASVFYNSEIFGLSVKKILEERGAKVFLGNNSENSNLLISAQGKPKEIKKEMIKKDAVIIDIGITTVKDRVWGDVDYQDVKNKAAFITPVPGGIGPMTIAFLFKNTWEIFKRRHK